MCAMYTIRPNSFTLGIDSENFEFPDYPWADRILPGRVAPVVVGKEIKIMKFALLPSWSKEPKVKFATHNARIETVLEKPTWRKPFEKNHCLVPIDSFIEPIYEGEYAGNMVKFNSSQPVLAAGIYDQWVNKETGEVIDSFSILTKEPSPFVAKIGHDRQPIFLTDPKVQMEWIVNKSKNSLEWQNFLSSVDNINEFNIEIDRKLKAK